jgi:serine/threonine protein kinase/Tol biopolymer transport system component
MTTSPERWATVERLYHAALARPVDERAAFLAKACAGDGELRREVESLLAQAASGEAGLTGGAAVAAAGLVTDIGGSVLTGRRLGAYQILAPLGAGGMGEVYRARDTRLGRDVAMKILPRAFTADAARLARFEREARVLASLNHPHIAAIHGIEDAPLDAGPPVRALVLELVEGETLADRIARAGGSKGPPLRVSEALDIARQIADALDAAHEKGIVHRDLKPANIKITPQGVVKVLDFGLAKLEAAGDGAEGVTEAPTITVNDTRAGLIVGTAAYMSPEQARGQAVDKRTDIWAFGCVLYEMLTGHAVFARETMTDTLAAVLDRDPDWHRLPESLPRGVRMLVRDCLEKDPRRRLRDIGDALRAMDADDDEAPPRSRRTAAIPAMVFIVGVAALSIVVWQLRRPTVTPGAQTQFTFPAPQGSALEPAFPVPSPDGSSIAFVARGEQSPSFLWIRRLDSSVPQKIEGTDGATAAYWSPDGRFIAFQAGGKLKRVAASGGPILTIASMGPSLGATWNADNVIVFAPSNRTPLLRVSADGGTPEPLTTLDASHGENSHRWPVFLPDGRHFLFTARSDLKEHTGIYVGSLDSKTTRALVTAQSNAIYAPPGFLLFAREGTVMAQRFDAGALAVSGEAVPVAAGVDHITASAQALFGVSADGNVLAYQGAVGRNSRLTWFDRSGHDAGTIGPDKDFTTDLQISPDGKQAVVVIPDTDSGNRDLWVVDLRTGGLTRLTTHPANDWQPAWEPDGAHVVFTSDRDGGAGAFRKAINGGDEEPIIRSAHVGAPKDYSPDGRFLLFAADAPPSGTDLWVLPRGGKPYPFVVSPFTENQAAFSPDGRWVTYESDESGISEIYLKPFAGPGKQQVSRGGGHAARWKRDGTEIFYLNPANQLMRVIVSGRDAIETSSPSVFLNTCKPGDLNPLYGGRWYDVAPDGRFLLPCRTAHEDPSITVTVGWKSQMTGASR